MTKTVTAKSKGHAKSEGHRKATHMHIRALENGVMASTEHEPQKQSRAAMKAGMGMGYEPPEEKAFTSKQELHKHIEEKFGDMLKDEPEEHGKDEEDDKGVEKGGEGENGVGGDDEDTEDDED